MLISSSLEKLKHFFKIIHTYPALEVKFKDFNFILKLKYFITIFVTLSLFI